VFYHCRSILDDCEDGYEMIGAHVQSLAIPEFRILCVSHEEKCRNQIIQCVETKDFQKFNDWMACANKTLRSDKESLFYSDSGLHELKEQWYAANGTRIKKLLR